MTNERKQLILAWFGLIEPKDVDGIWGPQSAAATRKLQKALGLQQDGDFGTATVGEVWNAVYEGRELRFDNITVSKAETVTGTFWDEIECFDRTEFKCTCGGRGCNGFPVEPVERLVRNLETTRKHFGKVVPVSSGVRCQLRNSELPGSAANSLHMRGKAADFAVTGIHSSVTLAYIKTLPNVDEAYAIDNSFVHMGVLEYE